MTEIVMMIAVTTNKLTAVIIAVMITATTDMTTSIAARSQLLLYHLKVAIPMAHSNSPTGRLKAL
jgi:hypothetical protein